PASASSGPPASAAAISSTAAGNARTSASTPRSTTTAALCSAPEVTVGNKQNFRGFAREVDARFRFLVDEFGLEEPSVSDHLTLSVIYEATGYAYQFWTDTQDREMGVDLKVGPAPPLGPLHMERRDGVGTIMSYHGPRRIRAPLEWVIVTLG